VTHIRRPDPPLDSESFFSFSSPLRNTGILGYLLAFLIQSTADLENRRTTILGEMTDADNVMHFGTAPADIRIRINPAIWTGLPDHL